LIGPEFALLRPEFSQLRSKSLSRRSLPKLKRILITMGGSDPDNETAKAVEAVVMSKISWDHVDVVVGLGFRGHEKLSLAMAELNSCSLHVQTDQMAELMLQSDLAITSSGSITWEKCSLGLPSIVVESGENEAELARCGHVFGFLYNLGPSWSVTVEDYVNILVGLIPDRLTSMTRVAQCLCDGTGVNRVANTILNFHR